MRPPVAYCAARNDFWNEVCLKKSPSWTSVRHEIMKDGRPPLPKHVLNGGLGELHSRNGPCGDDEYLSPRPGIETQKVLPVAFSLHRLRCTAPLN